MVLVWSAFGVSPLLRYTLEVGHASFNCTKILQIRIAAIKINV